MLFMCPIEKFKAICRDYPHTQKWMAQRSLMRRNYFSKIQQTLYDRHNVNTYYDHPRYKNKKLDEQDQENLRERVYKTVTRESAKINFDPYSTSMRQDLLRTEACSLNSERETKNFDGEALDYAQTQVSCLRASIAVGMARKQIEETTKKVFRLKLDFEERLINPVKNVSTKRDMPKDTHALKNISWVMETNMLAKKSTQNQKQKPRRSTLAQSPLLNRNQLSDNEISAFSRTESQATIQPAQFNQKLELNLDSSNDQSSSMNASRKRMKASKSYHQRPRASSQLNTGPDQKSILIPVPSEKQNKEGMVENIQCLEGPHAIEKRIPKKQGIQFQPPQQDYEECSEMTEELNESNEEIEESQELEDEFASGQQSSNLYVRQEAQDNVWESPMVVNERKLKAHQVALDGFTDANINEQNDDYYPESKGSRQSIKARLQILESQRSQDSGEADEEISIGDPIQKSDEEKAEQPNQNKEVANDKGSDKSHREDKSPSNLASNYMVREVSVDQIAQPYKKRLKQKSETLSKKRPKTNIVDTEKAPKANVKRNALVDGKPQNQAPEQHNRQGRSDSVAPALSVKVDLGKKAKSQLSKH